MQVPFAVVADPGFDRGPASQPQSGRNPVTPLSTPADPLKFDFDNVDIDSLLADAKRAEEEGARLVEEGKALQARAEQLRQQSTPRQSTPKQEPAIKSPAIKSKPSHNTFVPGQADVDRETDVEQVEISLTRPVDLPVVDGDELLSHVDGIVASGTTDRTDRDAMAPLQVEGITADEIDVDDLYGVKCPICDTRIHVTPDKVATQIECPICYSPVEVNPPSKKPRYRPGWNQPKSNVDSGHDSGELKLSDPIARPKVEHVIEPGWGLPDVEEDLLAPLDPPGEHAENVDEIPELRIVEVPEQNSAAQQNPGKVAAGQPRNQSLPQRAPASNQRSTAERTSRRERYENSQVDEQEKPLSVHSTHDLQPLTIRSLHEHVVDMVTDARLIIPVVTATIMLTVGDMLYDVFQDLRGPGAEVGFMNAFKLVISGMAFLAIYGCGTMVLWYVCSIVFRESARGNHEVESWRPHGYDEMKSTFLLFGFSFALAGLPFMMLGTYFSASVRILIAPLLLLVAWFNQDVFIGVTFGPFTTFRTQSEDWKQFYIYVFALALLSLVGGLLFYVPYCSIIAATLIVAATIAFAAASGWHIGRTVRMMDED